MLSICREFLSDRRQRVVVDGATSEWISIVSGMPQGELCWVLFLYHIYQQNVVSWLRTDYFPMQMTPHHWQLFASKQTDLLLLPTLTRTCNG